MSVFGCLCLVVYACVCLSVCVFIIKYFGISPMIDASICMGGRASACVYVCVCVCVFECVSVCVCVCV